MRSREYEVACIVQAYASLHALREVEFIGSLLETAHLSIYEVEGINKEELDRLCSYSRKWQAIDPRLQRVYQKAASSSDTHFAAVSALLRVMDKRQDLVSAATYHALHKTWENLYGYPPSIELVPIRRHR